MRDIALVERRRLGTLRRAGRRRRADRPLRRRAGAAASATKPRRFLRAKSRRGAVRGARTRSAAACDRSRDHRASEAYRRHVSRRSRATRALRDHGDPGGVSRCPNGAPTHIEVVMNGEKKKSRTGAPRTPARGAAARGLLEREAVCETGDCGACAMLDGRQDYRLVPDARRRKPTAASSSPVEGLETDGQADPIQEAFFDHGAVQCGFCTPG